MKLLSHQQESFIFSWSCHTLSARFSTCVSLRSTQKRRLSGPFSQPLHASLGAESGPQAVHTHAERQLWPRRHRLPNGCVGVGLAVPSWRVTADSGLRGNRPHVRWSHVDQLPSAWHTVGGHVPLSSRDSHKPADRRWCKTCK
jgi:hypothetical protein